MEREPDGMNLRLPNGELRIEILGDSAVRVAFSKSPGFFSRTSIARVPLSPRTRLSKSSNRRPATRWSPINCASASIARAARFHLPIARDTRCCRSAGGRILDPATVQGETDSSYSAEVGGGRR
jgi:hypothetical protein